MENIFNNYILRKCCWIYIQSQGTIIILTASSSSTFLRSIPQIIRMRPQCFRFPAFSYKSLSSRLTVQPFPCSWVSQSIPLTTEIPKHLKPPQQQYSSFLGHRSNKTRHIVLSILTCLWRLCRECQPDPVSSDFVSASALGLCSQSRLWHLWAGSTNEGPVSQISLRGKKSWQLVVRWEQSPFLTVPERNISFFFFYIYIDINQKINSSDLLISLKLITILQTAFWSKSVFDLNKAKGT